MITVNVYGGLGNQMFQYAFGRSIAIKKGEELNIDVVLFDKYDLRDFLLNRFNINAKQKTLHKCIVSKRYLRKLFQITCLKFKIEIPIYFEKKEFSFDKRVYLSNANYFYGYWQSYLYFDSIRNVLLNDFKLTNCLDEINTNFLCKIVRENSVSLHIRRGDYVSADFSKKGHGLCPISYYNTAIQFITDKLIQPTFYIFSDDINWVKDNLVIPFQTVFIDNNNNYPERDIELMKNCKHNIIANSTFSWWGAWLNENPNKIVIAPKKWMNNLNMPIELIPKNWIMI